MEPTFSVGDFPYTNLRYLSRTFVLSLGLETQPFPRTVPNKFSTNITLHSLRQKPLSQPKPNKH